MMSTRDMRDAGARPHAVTAMVHVRSMNDDELLLLEKCIAERRFFIHEERQQAIQVPV